MIKKLSIAFFVIGLSAASFAATKTYQVTGPVTDVNDTSVTVQKGKEKWEISKDASTKGAAAVKVGDKVTVNYTMTATEVEAKPAKKK